MSKPINVYSIPELRQALDEALPITLKRLNYTQSHLFQDIKLGLGYSMGLIAATSFLLDKKFKWNQTLFYQKLLVGLYFILSITFWIFNHFIEKGLTYQGINKKDSIKLKIMSRLIENNSRGNSNNDTPIYQIHFKLINVNNSTEKNNELTSELLVTKIFSEQGYLQTNLFYEYLNDQINLLKEKKKN
ncbi:hypothetical protein TBLA_0G02080 [Henningerozyma blattae CBS 6284]|uniref:Signal peptidase complex subunit 2 n=1 Tax=Henningerozyma blattae (strain ATCC 34711 / CBS 6284 / DSM 70876 / NBRC 10599 / NRRL Y-10934 / UCD 77-7) TaxID=1071380 RepID=I2H6Z8_HENB6|nr:hypothetical protein TBLA_0G02080 [Tetrapisispora blattae CBS 6284]CCH62150.1 hypothetical protein TBLA_0G02080 [Tetrapisispora blattae CBS 6284]